MTTLIIAILYALMFGESTAARQRRLKADCEKHLVYIYSALQTYATDHQGAFPVSKGAKASEVPLSLLIPRYTTVTMHFICPGQGKSTLPEAAPFADRRISYAYYMGQSANSGSDQPLLSDAQANAERKKTGDILFSLDGKKPANNHRKHGGMVLFCDGHAQSSGSRAAFDLSFPTNVVLLNPKP
jgi:prepilin-type processing-associated H-X9-DG protein